MIAVFWRWLSALDGGSRRRSQPGAVPMRLGLRSGGFAGWELHGLRVVRRSLDGLQRWRRGETAWCAAPGPRCLSALQSGRETHRFFLGPQWIAAGVFHPGMAAATIVQHTRHTEGNELECLSPDGTPGAGPRHPRTLGIPATRLMEIDLTEDRRERRLFDATAHSAAWSPDGTKRLVLPWRRATLPERLPRLARIADLALSNQGPAVSSARLPGKPRRARRCGMPDGKGFYFVSNETGTANLWLKRDGADAVQVTRYRRTMA